MRAQVQNQDGLASQKVEELRVVENVFLTGLLISSGMNEKEDSTV